MPLPPPISHAAVELIATIRDACDTFVRQQTGQPIILNEREAMRRMSRIYDLCCTTSFSFADDVPGGLQRALGLIYGIAIEALTAEPAQHTSEELSGSDHS
jgi:hypothetical protein